jgi:hypothetical protein
MFNAGHAALIPKGPHRGKVLVWTENAFAIRGTNVGPPGSLPNLHDHWGCQCYSIVEPTPTPGQPRFHNFLLPIGVVNLPPGASQSTAADIFCSGQAWSPFGDLVVVGGQVWNIPILGASLTYVWNPRLAYGTWPPPWGTAGQKLLGPNVFGFWQRGPALNTNRWYPTALLTHRLQRLATTAFPQGREVVLALGGSSAFTFSPFANPQWNTYESMVVNGPCDDALPSSGLAVDFFPPTSTVREWSGPGLALPSNWKEDWLENYPRAHLLGNGAVFFSGYAPKWALLDHDTGPGLWVRQTAPPLSQMTWPNMRYDGGSILLPNVNGWTDAVARIGGGAEISGGIGGPTLGTTASAEVWGLGSPVWAPGSDLPPNPGLPPTFVGRSCTNTVLLPDGSVLVIGGKSREPTTVVGPQGDVHVNQPLRWNGAWSVAGPDSSSPRGYHSIAILLPDGRVFVGGGEGRTSDYEIFSPGYGTGPSPTGVAFHQPGPTNVELGCSVVAYNSLFTLTHDPLPPGVAISRAVLMAPGATTHHFDSSQRYYEMLPVKAAGGALPLANSSTFRAPLNDKRLPRGIYMVFLKTNLGAISQAIWVGIQ